MVKKSGGGDPAKLFQAISLDVPLADMWEGPDRVGRQAMRTCYVFANGKGSRLQVAIAEQEGGLAVLMERQCGPGWREELDGPGIMRAIRDIAWGAIFGPGGPWAGRRHAEYCVAVSNALTTTNPFTHDEDAVLLAAVSRMEDDDQRGGRIIWSHLPREEDLLARFDPDALRFRPLFLRRNAAGMLAEDPSRMRIGWGNFSARTALFAATAQAGGDWDKFAQGMRDLGQEAAAVEGYPDAFWRQFKKLFWSIDADLLAWNAGNRRDDHLEEIGRKLGLQIDPDNAALYVGSRTHKIWVKTQEGDGGASRRHAHLLATRGSPQDHIYERVTRADQAGPAAAPEDGPLPRDRLRSSSHPRGRSRSCPDARSHCCDGLRLGKRLLRQQQPRRCR